MYLIGEKGRIFKFFREWLGGFYCIYFIDWRVRFRGIFKLDLVFNIVFYFVTFFRFVLIRFGYICSAILLSLGFECFGNDIKFVLFLFFRDMGERLLWLLRRGV